jgi:sarcosine oxidase
VERCDVAIVGGGPMGTAAARALGSRDRSVILFERFTLGHERGSSAGTTRNFRLTYHDPIYVRMARQALAGWRKLEDEAGLELLRTVGGLDVGDETDAAAAALAAGGEDFERPSAEAVAERWPALRFPEGSRFLYQTEGAIIRSRDAVQAQARLAAASGADLREETTVASVRPAGGGVEIRTDRGDVVRAAAAVVAAGAWTPSLLRAAAIDVALAPTLEQSTYLRTDAVGLPTVIDWAESPAQPPYIVPDPYQPGEIKAGAHRSGPIVDPDERSFDTDPEREARVVDWVRRRIDAPASIRRTQTCLYTCAPDDDFVVDRVGPIVIASPCSGHGFKFTPLIGELVADLATGAEPRSPIDRFGLDRAALRAGTTV